MKTISSLVARVLYRSFVPLFFVGAAVGAAPGSPANAVELLLPSAIALDLDAGTVTLPLLRGLTPEGAAVWYVLTEASDREVAERLGVNWSPKLANALGTPAVQPAAWAGGMLRFAATVDFRPEAVVIPDPDTGFPPLAATPGAAGEPGYSPLVTTGDGVVLNAPHVANGTGLHDRVVAIDFAAGEVVMAVTEGRYHGKAIFYVSTESSDPATAAIEAATFAPTLDAAPGLAANGLDSARSSIVPVVNGATGAGNPDRQGLQSALQGEGSPLNVTVIHPRNRGPASFYSPLWDVHPAVWTDAAIAAGDRGLLEHHAEVAKAAEAGLLASGGFGPPNPDLGGLRAAGFIVNCPIMAME